MTHDIVAAILEQASRGDLHDWLVETTETATEDRLASAYEAVLRLDSAGELDLLATLLGSDNSWELRPDYEARTRLYAHLIPRIDSDAARLVGAIRAITESAWQYSLDEAFRLWCEADRARPDEVLHLAGGRDPLEDRFLLPALVAGYKADPRRYLAIAIDIARGRRAESQTGSIYAIGAMPLAAGTDTRDALQTLADLILAPETDGRKRAIAFFAAAKLIARTRDENADIAEAVALRVAADPSPEVVTECARAVFLHGAQFPSQVRLLLAGAFRNVDTDSPLALNAVDIALAQMLRLGDEEDVVLSVQHLLSSGSAAATLRALDAVAHELSHGSRDRLGRLLARWLATGEPTLCGAARHLVFKAGDKRLACGGELGDADWPDALRVFVARKAIGWLMPHPTAPASILVGLLRRAAEGAAGQIASLLLDPLLVNYPLAARAYLEDVSRCMAEQPARWVAEALSMHASYMKAIEGVGLIPEFQPSRRHRQLHHRHRQAEMNASMRKARADSALFSIMSSQVILYGVRTICRVTDPDGTERRLVNEMKPVTGTVDRVMGLTYDAVGLELMLLELRAEPRPA